MDHSDAIPGGKLPLKQKLLYGTGDISVSVPLAILMFFQLYFLTDVAGLNPAHAAWAVMIGRVWDAVNDPWFGIISDRFRTRWGRRRVILLFGAVPLGVGFMLMWQVPALPEFYLTAYYTLTFIVFNTAFTFIRLGYYALLPELTSDYDERVNLNAYLMFYSICGSIGSIIFVTILGWYVTEPRSLYSIIGVALGALVILPPFIVFNVTREPRRDHEPPPLPFWAAVKATLTNRLFWRVMVIYTLSWTTVSIIAANLIYFITYYFQIPEQSSYFVLVAQGAALVFIPVWVWITKKLDKRKAFMLGMGYWTLILLAISTLRPGQVILAYLLSLLSGAGIANAYVLPWSMIPDVVEQDRLDTGQRREGSYYAFASFSQKLATGAALWVMGQALALVGYINPVDGAAYMNQPENVNAVIRLFMGPVPALFLIAALIVAWRYPVTREKHLEMRDKITAAG
ncbi:MAG: MFS transporter [Bacillota bacterium]